MVREDRWFAQQMYGSPVHEKDDLKLEEELREDKGKGNRG
jgi:hypothetical protein